MRKAIVTIGLLILCLSVKAQIDAGSVMGMPSGTTAQITTITTAPIGSCAFSTDEETIYWYTSSGWQRSTDNQNLTGATLNGSNQLQITIEGGNPASVDLSSLDQDAANVPITDSGNNFAADNVEAALAELASGSQNLATDNLTQDAETRTYDMNGQDLNFTNGSFGVGTSNPAGVLEARSNQNVEAFLFVQEDNLTGQKDVFTIEDQDTGGGGQDESSVLKVLKSGPINVGDNGFSLIELANTNTDPGANKYWISGRKTDEGAPLWGVDITDNDFWSEGGIALGVTGADGGSYSGGNFLVNSAGQITSNDLSGTGTRMVVADAGGVLSTQAVITDTDNQDASEVNLVSAVDSDGDTTNETTVEEVVQAIAPITSASGRIFYPPSIAIDASSLVNNASIDLYQQYLDQYDGSGSNYTASTGAPAIPTYGPTDLYYYVTYADPAVFNIDFIDASGNMQYDIVGTPADYNSLINVVFVVK